MGSIVRKKQTDTFCQYPAVEGLSARTGFVDFVTSDNPHCGNCVSVCFDIDVRAYVCRRFGVEVKEQSYCDGWLHERTHT